LAKEYVLIFTYFKKMPNVTAIKRREGEKVIFFKKIPKLPFLGIY